MPVSEPPGAPPRDSPPRTVSPPRSRATRHARLFKPDYEAEAAAALRRSYVGPGLYFLAILAAQIAVPISIGIQIVVPLLFFLPVHQSTGHR
jgi:hypothetical protein